MPRRSRGQTYHKRVFRTSTAPLGGASGVAESAPDAGGDEAAAVAAQEDAAAAGSSATYRQRIGRAPVTARVTAAAPQRASRMLITDYGYVVGEMKRIFVTFAGLIVLLVIISRLLH